MLLVTFQAITLQRGFAVSLEAYPIEEGNGPITK